MCVGVMQSFRPAKSCGAVQAWVPEQVRDEGVCCEDSAQLIPTLFASPIILRGSRDWRRRPRHCARGRAEPVRGVRGDARTSPAGPPAGSGRHYTTACPDKSQEPAPRHGSRLSSGELNLRMCDAVYATHSTHSDPAEPASHISSCFNVNVGGFGAAIATHSVILTLAFASAGARQDLDETSKNAASPDACRGRAETHRR